VRLRTLSRTLLQRGRHQGVHLGRRRRLELDLHDGLPDRWEKRHHLSLKVKQAKKDQEAAERAAKEAARQEKKANKNKGKADEAAALPQPDPIALAEARARAAMLAAEARPAATPAP